MLRPIGRLVAASQEVSQGNFSYLFKPISKSEIGKLGRTFNFMAASFKERDDEIKAGPTQRKGEMR